MKRVSKLVLLSTVGIFLSVQASIASSQLDDALENGAKRLSSSEIAKQFVGKTPKDELKYMQNIVAIAGATISVRSMTTAVNDLLRSLKILQTKHNL